MDIYKKNGRVYKRCICKDIIHLFYESADNVFHSGASAFWIGTLPAMTGEVCLQFRIEAGGYEIRCSGSVLLSAYTSVNKAITKSL